MVTTETAPTMTALMKSTVMMGGRATDPLRSNYGSTLNGAATMWHCIMLATIWLHCATYSMAKYDDYNMAQIW